MENAKIKVMHSLHRTWQYVSSFIKWVFIALVCGTVGGAVGGAFRFCVDYVTNIRHNNEYLIYFLPLAGLLIVLLYKLTKLNNGADTNLVIKSIQNDVKVPFLLAPAIFVSTVITHLFGGSAGREGAALQMGGSIGAGIGHLFKLDKRDMHICVMCGMSGLFSALFCTPLTATIFVLEFISVGAIYYSALVPCVVSSLVSYAVTKLMGLSMVQYNLYNIPQVNVWSSIKVAIVGVLCAVVGVLFCMMLHLTHKCAKKFIKNEYLRIAAGGVLIVVLTLLLSRRYIGLGEDVIHSAFTGGAIYWYDPLLKILFTAITIGFGYKGGEIVPTLFIGSTLGYVVGTMTGLDPAFSAAVGMAALFCAVTNCPLASLALCVELFSGESIMLFMVAIAVSFMLSGYYSIYSSQIFVYSKRREKIINKFAK